MSSCGLKEGNYVTSSEASFDKTLVSASGDDMRFKLFGVPIPGVNLHGGDESIRRSNSLGILRPYELELPVESSSGYSSDGSVHNKRNNKGMPWTEEEHIKFLQGLDKLGKGNWKGISKKFVKTRSPTQVASHAQKYFIRKSTVDKRKRRNSVFDTNTDDHRSSTTSVPGIDQSKQCRLERPPLSPFNQGMVPQIMPSYGRCSWLHIPIVPVPHHGNYYPVSETTALSQRPQPLTDSDGGGAEPDHKATLSQS